jgi:hypothetical protein
MNTFDLKIYPHLLMVRGNEDEHCAMNYADDVYNIVKNMLDKHKIKYVDESNNEDCILLIKEPDNMKTRVIVKKILCIFDCVHKRDRYIII